MTKERRREISRAYYQRNKELCKERARASREKNPEAYKNAVSKWKEKNPDRERVRNLAKFNLTIEQYEQMSANQNGVCAICGHPETSSRNGVTYRLAVDHDHATGKVRGLLCFKCNSAMGSFEKRNVPFHSIAAYLEAYK